MKLIEILGPNFNDASMKQVNSSVDVKEELYVKTRLVKLWSVSVDRRYLATFLLLWISAWSISHMILTIIMMSSLPQ